jgi:hypothetical protein
MRKCQVHYGEQPPLVERGFEAQDSLPRALNSVPAGRTMKNALVKTAFIFTVIFLTAFFLLVAYAIGEFVFPEEHRHFDTLLPGIICLFFCIWIADQITALVFSKTHLTDGRWSLLRDPTLGIGRRRQ